MVDEAPTAPRAAPRSKSGSEKRKRQARFTVRCTNEQREALTEAAARSGLSFGSYVLGHLLKVPPPAAGKVPTIERQQLAQLLAQLGRLNGNINQIAKALNFGQGFARAEIQAAAAGIVSLRDDIRAALGRKARNDN